MKEEKKDKTIVETEIIYPTFGDETNEVVNTNTLSEFTTISKFNDQENAEFQHKKEDKKIKKIIKVNITEKRTTDPNFTDTKNKSVKKVNKSRNEESGDESSCIGERYGFMGVL